MLSIFIIGTGHLGSHMCKLIEEASLTHPYLQLKGYTNRSKRVLEDIKAPLIINWMDHLPVVDLILITTPDRSIGGISQALTTEAVVAHMAGSVGIDELQHHDHRGVFYVPQSFSKERLPILEGIHACLEHNSDKAEQVLIHLAQLLFGQCTYLNSHQRQQLHLSAVYVNNFVNHCYALAEGLSAKAQLDPQLLYPLMKETFLKAMDLGAQKAQTGPAVREDRTTINKHLSLLPDEMHEVYLSLTKSIMDHEKL